MQTPPLSVGVNVLVVPDGVRRRADGNNVEKTMCRLSLSLTPNVTSGPGGINLRDWPSVVDTLAHRIRIVVGRVAAGAGDELTVDRIVCLPAAVRGDVSGESVAEAVTLWRKIFETETQSFQGLFNALKPPDAKTKALLAKADAAFPLSLGSYDGAAMAGVVESLYASAAASTLVQRADALQRAARMAGATNTAGAAAASAASAKANGQSPAAASAIVPAFDATRPSVSWWREFQEQWLTSSPAHQEARMFRRSGVAAAAGAGAARAAAAPSTSAVSLASATAAATAARSLAHDVVEAMKGAAKAAAAEPPASQSVAALAFRGETSAAPASTSAPASPLRQASAFFEQQVMNPDYWQTGFARPASAAVAARAAIAGANANATAAAAPDAATTADAATASAFQRELMFLQKCWAMDGTVEAPSEKACTQEDRDNAPRRKLAGILSYPTLAKFLRLIVDVEVEWDAIRDALGAPAGGRVYGAVAAVLQGDGAAPMTACPAASDVEWTAFVHADASGGRPAYFGPCSKAEARQRAVAKHWFSDGAIDLTVRLATEPRFELVTISVTNAMLELNQTAAAVREASRNGVLPADQVTRLPQMQTRGIALFDRAPRTPPLGETKPPPVHISFADDMTLGYRIDVALARKKSGGITRDRWRTLTGRTLVYDSDVPEGFLSLAAVRAVARREDGHVRPGTGTTEVTDETGARRQLTAAPELFTWTGESLGAPSLHHEDRVDETDRGDQSVELDPECDLALNMTVSVPEASDRQHGEADRRPPPLRETRGYVFGARAYLVNGCGLSFEDAVSRYIADKDTSRITLGARDGKPYVFQRRSEIAAPHVLLPWNDRLVLARKLSEETPGETIDTLVVRSGGVSTPEARRFVVPARTTFDLSEQAGEFDHDELAEVGRPPGAFTGDVGVLFCKETGTFPLARDGTYEFPCEAGAAGQNARADGGQSRGSVLVLHSKPASTDRKFYPDPLGSQLRARFAEDGQEAWQCERLASPVPFWRRDLRERPEHARPVLLRLRGPRANEAGTQRGQFQVHEQLAAIRPSEGRTMHVPALDVILAPAEAIDLELWPDDDSDRLCERLWMLCRSLELAEQLGRNVRGDVASILAAAPMAQVVSKRTIRLVHAVDRPLTPPRFLREGGRLMLHPVVITVAPEPRADAPATASGLPTWRTYVHANQGRDQLTWPSEAGGSTAFFVGSIDVDRKSTGSVRCEASWREFRAQNVRFDTVKRQWCLITPPQSATLFSITQIRTDESWRGRPIDLLREEGPFQIDQANGLRALSHAFGDGKARQLTARLIAASRFTSFYPPPPPSTPESTAGLGPYERESEGADREATFWIPATKRPAPPQVDQVLPLFKWREHRLNHGRRIEFSRDSWLRIYLKHESWPNQEGEKLAVTFGPPPLPGPTPICGFEQRVKEFAPFVTRWGADPIQLSGDLAQLVPEQAFQGHEPRVDGLPMPFGHEPIVLAVLPPCTGNVEPKTKLTVAGQHFVAGATVRINGQVMPSPTLISDREIEVVVPAGMTLTCPLRAIVENPTLPVSILPFKPELDRDSGHYYVDLRVDPQASYAPFVQFGLCFYEKESVAGLELSTPVTAWAQVPPVRTGNVTFTAERRVVLELHGIGFADTNPGPEHAPLRRYTDAPLLNVRLLRASSPGRVPDGADGSIQWMPAIDHHGLPIERLRVPAVAKADAQTHEDPITRKPLQRNQEAWWCLPMTLPRCSPSNRYALLVEEIELRPGDVADVSLSAAACAAGAYPAELRERTVFSHIIDLGACP